MAADVITRFRLETTAFDSKLRDTAKSLQNIAHTAEFGGKTFNDFSQKSIEIARSLGTVQSGATNTKDKLKDLVGSFNDAAKAYNSLNETAKQGEFGKALEASLQKLQRDIKETKEELYGLGDVVSDKGGGLFSGLGEKMSGALSVFGGNLMTKGFELATGAVTSFVGEIGDAVKQGIQLAKEGEGIRIAFQRLGRGDILDGLRQATHGTVTDLELMKAAVKFNDFKLPVEELGTMLAFAQQKAKDTGQSVDYMVDSIVTGLGRKSLMILDNLGLSASEVKERMKETGDMTKAVGEIIREQMAKAGDYVETAADRAAQANVDLQNKMEELGRKFAPIEEASNQLWTSMKIGILDIIGGPLATLLNQLTEAGRMKNALNDINGTGSNTKLDRMLGNLRNARSGNRNSVYEQQQAEIWKYINSRENYMKDRGTWVKTRDEGLRQSLVNQAQSFGTSNVNEIKAQIAAAKQLLAEYQAGAKGIMNPEAAITPPTITPTVTPKGSGKGGKKEVSTEDYFKQMTVDFGNLNANDFKGNPDANFESPFNMMKPQDAFGNADEWKKYKDTITESVGDINEEFNNLTEFTPNFDPHKKNVDDMTKALKQQQMAMSLASNAAQGFGAALASIGDPGAKAAGTVVEAIANIVMGFSLASAQAAAVGVGWGWLAWVGAGLAALTTTISTVHNLTGYAQGGMVEGNTYSNDQIPIMANAGELVLTKAMQGNLASQLQGSGMQNLKLEGVITGENLHIIHNRYLQRTGQGELVTW